MAVSPFSVPPASRWRARRLAPALLTIAVLAAAVPARGQDTGPAPALAYEVAFDGLEGGFEPLEAELRAASLAVGLADDPPAGRAGLARRAEQDVERFQRVLRANGHYDGSVAFTLEPRATGEPVALTFQVDPGALYLIEAVEIAEGDGPAREADADLLDRMGLWIGQPARAQTVIDAENALLRAYRADGHPFAEIRPRRAAIVPERETMRLTFRLDPGPRAVFGAARFDGLDSVDPTFARRHLAWQAGAPYDIRLLEDSQLALIDTGLFDSVALEPEPTPDPGVADIRVRLVERAHRSIGFGAGYATDIGLELEVFWEHRNLFSEGERLRLDVEASEVARGLDGTYREPFFRRADQDLIAELALTDTTSDAFDERRFGAFLGAERRLSDSWTATLGPTFDLIDQEATESEEDGLVLVGLRGNLRRDDTDDPLDPTRGARLDFAAEPYLGLAGADADFLSLSARAARYLSIDADATFVLAGRARAGVILGAERAAIPAGKRFYAGGGGSVRGYGFQDLGPRDRDGDPSGGRSVLELGLELRARLTETLGLVPFLEGGDVFADEFPGAEDFDLRWAAGLGLRYFTDFGPLRLDVAIPLDQRRGIDDDYQIYISLGQAF